MSDELIAAIDAYLDNRMRAYCDAELGEERDALDREGLAMAEGLVGRFHLPHSDLYGMPLSRAIIRLRRAEARLARVEALIPYAETAADERYALCLDVEAGEGAYRDMAERIRAALAEGTTG